MLGENEKVLHAKDGEAPTRIISSTGESLTSDARADRNLEALGYKAELKRNRSMLTLLFQSLAIAAIPYGEGAVLLTAIIGGGPLAIFLGWIVVCILDECVAISISEIASRFPTSAGPYYWSYQLAPRSVAVALSFITGWIWVVGNITITLSVNFGMASLISGLVTIWQPDYVATSWQLLLIFYATCLLVFVICVFANNHLPMIDTICAGWTLLSIIIIFVTLSAEAKAGRNSAGYALGHFDNTLSGWGNFGFFIGILPVAYTFSAIGMISSMAEEVADPEVRLPRAISLCVPVGGIAGLFFILPICFTLPPLETLLEAPAGQALPWIFYLVTGSKGGCLGLTTLVLVITIFCGISITVASSRTIWAFSRDDAIPGSRLWSKIHKPTGSPLNALALLTIIEMLLGIIIIGSTTAFFAFVSAGVIGLALSYAIPIGISFFTGRRAIASAKFNMGVIGYICNVVTLIWIAFETVLFSMPTVIPTTAVAMNYASVVVVGFMAISAFWYVVYARKAYKGPPASDAIVVVH